MLLYLTEILRHIHSGFNVFGYLTMRSILSALTALAISLLVGPAMIRRLSHYQIGQTVRTDGPSTHLDKAGTPTMGGALILVAVAVSTLLWASLSNRFVWVVLGLTIAFGLIGFIDDYRKLVLRDSKGLAARWKYLLQSVAGLSGALALYLSAQHPEVETALYVPFFKTVTIQLGAYYVIFAYFVIVGTSNAVNLTDGLDGLAIMPAVMVGAALGIFAYATGNVNFAAYLSIPYISGAGELLVFCGALTGAGLGIPLVQHLSRAGVHGRHRRARARRRARRWWQ